MPPQGARGAAVEVDLIAAAVLRCPGVASLHSGGLSPVVTYLPGRRVSGVSTDGSTVRVAVVAAYGLPMAALATQVRSALAALAAGRVVDVLVADVRTPEEQAAEEQAALPAGTV